MEKQINGCVDNTRRFQKIMECCGREGEYIKESLIIYLNK